jgi:hypothetical protein
MNIEQVMWARNDRGTCLNTGCAGVGVESNPLALSVTDVKFKKMCHAQNRKEENTSCCRATLSCSHCSFLR